MPITWGRSSWPPAIMPGWRRCSDGQFALCRGRDEAERPILRVVRHPAAAAAASAVSDRRISQGRDSPDCRAAAVARGRKVRQPGNLLRSRPGSRPFRPPAPRRDRHLGRDRDHATARWWAVTTGSSDSPSASARACVWRLTAPRYVVRIEPDSHRVVIGTYDELARNELTAAEANWLVRRGPLRRGNGAGRGSRIAVGRSFHPAGAWLLRPARFRAQVKIRYRSRPALATVEVLPGNRFRVAFDEPCRGVAPGQAAVCYEDDRVLGGGWIQ